MVAEIAQHLPQIAALCRAYGVRRLERIGSAARGDFDPGRSDFDFLVGFADSGWQGSSDRYFGLLSGLEDLLGRTIDLVQRSAVRNSLFLAVAERQLEVI